MSYFVGIYAKKQLDGSIPMRSFEKMSATFRVPDNGKDAEGFIQSKGRTSLGIVWVPNNTESVSELRKRLKSRSELRNGGYKVRELSFGPNRLAVVNMLVPQPEIGWLEETFRGVSSNRWFFEQTGWWDSYNNDITCVPPDVVNYDKRKFVMFSLGRIGEYFRDDTYDQRGKQFREKHPNINRNGLDGLLFREQVKTHGIEDGLRRMTQSDTTGLLHSNVVIYYDEKNNSIKAAHLHHESISQWNTVIGVDNDGNQLITVGREITLGRLRDHWHNKIEGFQNIEGSVLTKEVAGFSSGLERIV